MLYILLLHFVYHLSPFIRMSAPWRQRFGLFCSLLCLDQCFIHSRCSTNICWIYELINKLHRHTGRKQFPIKDIDQMAFRFCCNFESHKTVRQYLWNFERKSLWFKTTLFSAKLFICEDNRKCIIYELIQKYKNKANRILEDILHFDGDTRMGKSTYKVRVVNIKTS